MADLQRDSQRISLFRSTAVAASSGTATSDTWNITQGQAFSLHTEAITSSSASISCAISMYPGINGGGVPVVNTLASLAVGVLNESAIELNATICKSVKAVLTNAGSSAAVVTQSLLMF